MVKSIKSGQEMYWFGEYEDGDVIKEQASEFGDIEKDRLAVFGLKGLGLEFTHNIKKGQMKINNTSIVLAIDDKIIGKSNDIINFKEKIDSPQFKGNGRIIGYYTGWKEKLPELGFKYCEVLYWVDLMSSKLKIRLRLTPENKNESKLTVISDGVDEFPLKFEGEDKQEFVFQL